MRSVADRLKAEERARLAALSPAERARLALELGERDLETFRLDQDPPSIAQRPVASSNDAAGKVAAHLAASGN